MESHLNSVAALKEHLKTAGFKGDTDDSSEALDRASKDASLFVVRPRLVVFPKDSADIQLVVRFVADNKSRFPDLSVTARSAGTDMSGGPLSESVIIDVSRHMQGILSLNKQEATVLPGTFYRDFEPKAAELGVLLPCYTASKNLNTIGGMVANDSAGEKTLLYGKTENYVKALKIVLEDGNEYVVKPLTKAGLDAKIAGGNGVSAFESALYKKMWDLVSQNELLLSRAKPKVTKNSAGYYLWNVWDPKANNGEGSFDLTRLICGSQGTLGIVTEVTIRLVPIRPLSKLFVVFMPSLNHLGDIVNDILEFKPESLESYDDSTMSLAVKFLPSMLKTMKLNFFRLMWSFIPEAFMAITGGFPKLVLLIEFSGDSNEEIEGRMARLEDKIRHYGFKMRRAKDEFDSEKYWTIRRESFNLLRQHVHGRRTAPFVDDVVVPVETMPEFLPKMRAILDDYKLVYTIAGHAGNGNFHIIPLMDMKDESNRRAIDEVSDKVYDLVLSFGGSITAEHNDGIVRTPYLAKQFGPEVMGLFQSTKGAFDRQNIFNPGKKVGGTKAYMMEHLSRG